jgi:hypothetical protein
MDWHWIINPALAVLYPEAAVEKGRATIQIPAEILIRREARIW